MSKEYCFFAREDGKIAYMAGIVDILSDNLDLICDYGCSFTADIFFVKDNNISLLNDIVRKRLHTYNTNERYYIPEDDINNLDFQLELVNKDIKEYLFDVFSKYSSSKEIFEEINDFCQDLEWYLKKPICIYKPKEEIINKTMNVLGHIYFYVAFEYFFIVYDEWFVLCMFGTVE